MKRVLTCLDEEDSVPMLTLMLMLMLTRMIHTAMPEEELEVKVAEVDHTAMVNSYRYDDDAEHPPRQQPQLDEDEKKKIEMEGEYAILRSLEAVPSWRRLLLCQHRPAVVD